MENMLHTTPTLSHEINNYLTIIYSQLQHIEHLYKYLSKDEHWIRMKEDFSSAFRLLQELMEEENLTCAATEPTLVSSFLKHLYQSWSPRLSEQGIQLSIPTEVEHVELPVSTQQLEHIFHNILTNSYDAICKKTESGYSKNTISIQTELHPKSLVRTDGCIFWKYWASRKDCKSCPLQSKCLTRKGSLTARYLLENYFRASVQKNMAQKDSPEYRKALKK